MTTSDTIESAPLAAFLRDSRGRVEAALARFLPVEDDPSADCPPRLASAMRYSLLGGGKRLRPILVLMAAEACGGDPESALPAACAVEMVHTYSLIHDDLPAMDDDDLRRGRPTCHKAFDEAAAILAGDGLLTLAFETIVRYTRPPEAAARCVLALAEGSGPRAWSAARWPTSRPRGGPTARSRPSKRSIAGRPGRCSGRL